MGERRAAFVTGGAKRVGAAIVRRLAAAGFDVVFTCFQSESDAQATRTAAEAYGVAAEVLTADLEHDDPADIANAARRHFGRIDVLVNNAALFLPDDTPDGATLPLQRRLMEVNCLAPTALMTAFAPDLRVTRGAVVNLLDLLAGRPWPHYSAYCASKAALHAQTLAYARRLAPEVRVNGIAPGVIDWPDDMPEPERQKYLQRVPLARAGTPDDAADLVLWLATAAPYVTGQVIGLDGGRSLV